MAGNPIIEIGNYTVLLDQEIGRGGFGNVFQATNNNNRQIAAAKKINLKIHPQAHIREAISFYNRPPEHVNLIQLFDITRVQEVTRDDFWVFMQYAEHGDLNIYFQHHFPMIEAIGKKILFMEQIASGIAYLHSCDIIHRDIKPSNILVSTSIIPEEAILKITDLGLAKYLQPDAMTSGMNSPVGTESFKAPEFWLPAPDGSIRYHRNVDAFATGLTFQAMLQAADGKMLIPVLENTLDPISERRLPIGLTMVNRMKAKQTSVNPIADKETDDRLTKAVKVMIRKMVHVIPEHRLSMEDVHKKLSSEENVLV